MLGHASLDTTMMYAHVVDADLQRQYEKYHTI
jgi:site-specific recombinase XerD